MQFSSRHMAWSIQRCSVCFKWLIGGSHAAVLTLPAAAVCGVLFLTGFRPCIPTLCCCLSWCCSKPRFFSHKPGQYLFLCCPKISPYEWHPFTITSSPQDSFISLHIKRAGNLHTQRL